MSSARWCRGPGARGGVLPFCMRKDTGTMSKTPSREYRIMHRHLSSSYTPAFASRYCSYKGRVNFHDNWLSSDFVWLIGAGWRKIGFQSFTVGASKYQCMLLLTHHLIGSLKPDTWAVKAVVGRCEWPFHPCRGGKSWRSHVISRRTSLGHQVYYVFHTYNLVNYWFPVKKKEVQNIQKHLKKI